MVGKVAPQRRNRGYLIVSLRQHGEPITRTVHRLVLEAFAGPSELHCRHLNGDRADNRIENLCWGTPSENAEDRRAHGTLLVGAKNPMTKLSDDDVRAIRASGDSAKELAQRFSVHVGHIHAIKRGVKRCSIS